MVDYAKLADEEKARKDAADAAAEAERRRERAVPDFFKSVEAHPSEEVEKANPELKKRNEPTFGLPHRPFKEEERVDIAYGERNPGAKLTLQTTEPEIGLSRIQVELFGDAGDVIGKSEYVLERDGSALRAFKALVEGFPNHDAELTSAEIAQNIVSGIIRGRFE